MFWLKAITMFLILPLSPKASTGEDGDLGHLVSRQKDRPRSLSDWPTVEPGKKKRERFGAKKSESQTYERFKGRMSSEICALIFMRALNGPLKH